MQPAQRHPPAPVFEQRRLDTARSVDGRAGSARTGSGGRHERAPRCGSRRLPRGRASAHTPSTEAPSRAHRRGLPWFPAIFPR